MNKFIETQGLILFGTVAVTCLIFGYVLGASDIRREAVRHNSAKWFPDESGAPKFTWGQ